MSMAIHMTELGSTHTIHNMQNHDLTSEQKLQKKITKFLSFRSPLEKKTCDSMGDAKISHRVIQQGYKKPDSKYDIKIWEAVFTDKNNTQGRHIIYANSCWFMYERFTACVYRIDGLLILVAFHDR